MPLLNFVILLEVEEANEKQVEGNAFARQITCLSVAGKRALTLPPMGVMLYLAVQTLVGRCRRAVFLAWVWDSYPL